MDANRLGVTMVTSANYANYPIFSTNTDNSAVPNNPRPSSRDPAAKQIAWQASGSLEAIHGIYHVLFGGWGVFENAGHMSEVPCAAFDPIFWGHHGKYSSDFNEREVLINHRPN
jgi:hypothetical protein